MSKPPVYEKVKDGELGIKQTLFAGRVSLDANLFWTNLTGLQANITPPNGAKSYLANVNTRIWNNILSNIDSSRVGAVPLAYEDYNGGLDAVVHFP